MQNSKKLMEVAKVYPKLRLGERREGNSGKVSVHSTGPHRVKMVEDRVLNGKDKETGETIQVVKYIVEEGGELRQYIVPVKSRDTGDLHYLVQRLSEVEEGQEVILEMKKRGPKSYVEVLTADGHPIGEEDSEEEYNPEEPFSTPQS